MLLYHFGSREGLVAAIVTAVESAQRETMVSVDASKESADIAREVWSRVSDPQMRPFVQLFFEAAAYASRMSDVESARRTRTKRARALVNHGELTTSWIDAATAVASQGGHAVDALDLRLGIAVTRGLLVDVISGGDLEGATKALERFLATWPRRTASPLKSTTRPISSRATGAKRAK